MSLHVEELVSIEDDDLGVRILYWRDRANDPCIVQYRNLDDYEELFAIKFDDLASGKVSASTLGPGDRERLAMWRAISMAATHRMKDLATRLARL